MLYAFLDNDIKLDEICVFYSRYDNTSNQYKELSSVSWKKLNEIKEPSFCSQSRPDDCDELLVVEKGKTYFYSLPDQSCKSEIFIVHRDQVSAVEYFPDKSGSYSNGNFVRVVYSSKQLKKEIIGWIELKRLCRLNANGHCPSSNLKPK